MTAFAYTKNFKLIKPAFDKDPWHQDIYDNLDVIDALIASIMQASNFRGVWKNNTKYEVGDTVTEPTTNSMYLVEIEHTTDDKPFIEFRNEHPDYYSDWNGMFQSKQWAVKMDGKIVDSTGEDYSSKAYAISTGLIADGSAKEWATKATAVSGSLESAKTYAERSQASADASAVSASEALASMNSAEGFKNASEASAQESADSAADAMTYANNAEASAVASEASNQSVASTVNGFDTHAAQKQTEFDNNAAQKQAAVDASANTAAQYATNSQNSADAAAASAAEVAGAVIMLSQTSGIFTLETNKNYTFSVSGESTISIAEPTNKAIVNQTFIEMQFQSVVAVNWGDVLFVNGEAPDISTAGTYMVYYQWSLGGNKWLVGLYKVGA